MTMQNQQTACRVAAVAAAVAAAFSSGAFAQEVDDMTRLIKPESTVRFGIGSIDVDNARFGQYRGLQDSGVYGIADVDVLRRDDATGTWLKLHGRNLGLDSRELGLTYGPQGNWKVWLDYRELPRQSQYTINTGLQGVGSERLHVQSTGKRDIVPEVKREKLSAGFQKHLSDKWMARVGFSSEEKDGERLFGRGTSAAPAPNRWFNFLTEPIDSTISQWEAILAYNGPRFQIQGGYHGSQYSNHNTRLDVTGGGTGLNLAGAGTLSPIALPPSNDAHQFFIDGGYTFTPTTRASFKVSHTKATQNDAFIGNPPGVVNSASTGNSSGRARLGGHVDTTLGYVSLSSRPLPKLSLIASLRYEDRDDKTPVVRYIDTTATGNHDGRNEVRDYRAEQGKFEANYQLPAGYRVVLAAEHERKERNTSAVRVVSYRERTEEASWRAELRKTMSETLTGAIAYINSDRTGSDFAVNRTFGGGAGRNLIAPIHLADRDREKVRLSLDWVPIESLNLQLIAEDSRDTYGTRAELGLGARKGDSQLYSLDATYHVTDAWTLTGWATHAANTARQATAVAAPEAISLNTAQINALNIWSAALVNTSDAVGLGTNMKVGSKLKVGADFEFSQDRAEYRLARERGTMNLPAIPDIKYRTATFRLFGSYALQKNQGFRLDFVHDRRVIDDWTWETWVYQANTAGADGTTIRQDETQTTNFVGLSYYYKWW